MAAKKSASEGRRADAERKKLNAKLKKANDALKESRANFYSIVEKSTEAIIMVDKAGIVRFVNAAAEGIFGRKPDEFLGEVFGFPTTPKVSEIEIMRPGQEPGVGEMRVAETTWKGEPAFLVSIRDITERKRFEYKITRLATHDPLTGLANRRQIEEELEHHLALGQRYGHATAILWLDIDGFKEINDYFGHQTGDQALKEIAGLLRKTLRSGDALGRIGGDEFMILLPHTALKQAQVAAKKIVEKVRQHPMKIGSQYIRLTVSIGIAAFPGHGTTMEKLFSCADLAMYKAKEGAGNQFCICSHDENWQSQLKSKISGVWHLRKALDENRFELYAQPIIDLKTDKVYYYELLLRLRDKEGKILLPDTFLGLAERSGLIHDIQIWVLSQAIRIAAEQHRAGRNLCLGINISCKSFQNKKLLELVKSGLRSKKIDPSHLLFEFTESSAIPDFDQAVKFMNTLKNQGFQCALDDFGAGFYALFHLKYLPVNYVKIDGNFIRNLPRDPINQQLVQAIVHMSTALNKKTIGEWIESEETVSLLCKYGVDYVQGYYFARPRPISEIIANMEKSSLEGEYASGALASSKKYAVRPENIAISSPAK